MKAEICTYLVAFYLHPKQSLST